MRCLYPCGSLLKVYCIPSHVEANFSLSSSFKGTIKNISFTPSHLPSGFRTGQTASESSRMKLSKEEISGEEQHQGWLCAAALKHPDLVQERQDFYKDSVLRLQEKHCLQKAAVLVLLGVFWTQTSALETFVLQEPSNAYVTGTMTIHNEKNFAEVHVNSGVYSSDTIFDYSHGYIATRLFSRNACFILKIDKEYIPELQELGRLAFERKTMKAVYSPNNVWAQFQSGHSVFGKIKDWFLYGKPIEQLCSGLPLYQLVKTEPLLKGHGCASAGIPSILGLNICEKVE
ncbi:gastrokine-2 isoform 1-T1 [Theristicus caerulescens]